MEGNNSYFRFTSEIKAFIKKILDNPIKAEPTSFLSERGFNKDKLINILIKRGVIGRRERILDSTNSDEKTPKYKVKYKQKLALNGEKFYDIMEKVFKQYIKDRLNECDGAGGCDAGGCACDGCEGVLDQRGAFVAPFGTIISQKPLGGKRKRKKGETRPENVLGKTLTAEGKRRRRIYITESQFNELIEATATSNVGDYQYDGTWLDLDKDDPTIKGRARKIKKLK